MAFVVSALVMLLVPRPWRMRVTILWLLTPVIGYVGVITWETVTRPQTGNTFTNALLGLSLISGVLLIPWLVVTSAGFAIGLGLRRLLRRDKRPMPDAAPPAAPAQSAMPAPVAVPSQAPPDPTPSPTPAPTNITPGWRRTHIGFSNDGLTIGGMDIWQQKWRPVGQNPVYLPHPAYPEQTHRYTVYDAGDDHPVRFAAGELSNGVWGFYVPSASAPVAQELSVDGALRYEHRPGEPADDRYDPASSWVAALIDVASGRMLVDCAAWASSRITAGGDGSLLLHAQQNHSDALFRIDPASRQFRNEGERGGSQPLADLVDAVELARQALIGPDKYPGGRRISPDGTIRVDLTAAEWSNTHWVRSPRVLEIVTGRVVLDLWETDWNASVSFPRERCVSLDLRRYRVGGGGCTVELDLARDTYRILQEPGRVIALPAAPLTELMAGLEASSSRTAAFAEATVGPLRGAGIRPRVAWRSMLLILVGASAAIAAATLISLSLAPQRQHEPVLLRTVPEPRLPPGR